MDYKFPFYNKQESGNYKAQVGISILNAQQW